jgi:hypothetical protein
VACRELVQAIKEFKKNSECDCHDQVLDDPAVMQQIAEATARNTKSNIFYTSLFGILFLGLFAPTLIPVIGVAGAAAPAGTLFAAFTCMLTVSTYTGYFGTLRSWFYRSVVTTVYEVAASEAAEKIGETKKKVMKAIGVSHWTDGAQNFLMSAFGGISITAIGAIVYVTYTFIKKNKYKITKEGATPISLAPSYLKQLGLALGVLGIAAITIVQTSSLLNAVRNLSSFGQSMYDRSRRTVAEKGTTMSKHMPLKTLLPLLRKDALKTEIIYTSDNLYTAVHMSAANRLAFGTPLHDMTKHPLEYIGEQLTDKLKNRYPGLAMKVFRGVSYPAFDSAVGQQLLKDINSVTYVRRDTDFIDDYAVNSCALGGSIIKGTFVQRYVYYNGNAMVKEDANTKSKLSVRFSQFYKELIGLPDLAACEVYVFTYKSESYRVYANSAAGAKSILGEKDDDITLLETFALLKENVEDKWKTIGGILAVILIVFIGYYFWFRHKWGKKDEAEQESVKKPTPEGADKGTKGQHIKAAEEARWAVKDAELKNLRTTLRDSIENAQKAKAMDLKDGDYSYAEEYDRSIASLQMRLGDVDETIQAIYDGDYSESFVPKGRSKKNANQDRTLPNSAKPRKNKEGVQGCIFKDCPEDNEGREVCGTHYRQLVYKNTDPAVLPGLTKYLIKNVRQNKVGQRKEPCGYVECINYAKVDNPYCRFHENKETEIKPEQPKGESKPKDKPIKKKAVYKIKEIVKETVEENQDENEKKKNLGDNTEMKLEGPAPGPSMKKLKNVLPSIIVKESAFSDLSNPQSFARQVPHNLKAPLVPIYILRDRGYVRAGVGFLGISESKTSFYSAWHVVKDGAYIKKAPNIWREIKFTQIGLDFAVSSDAISISGSPFKIAHTPTTNGKDYRLYTLSVDEDKPMMVQCNGSVSGGRFRHTSDTFPAQCGSPYVSKNIVEAFHTQSIVGSSNDGDMIVDGPSVF